jgi:hypothetical protein
MDLATFNDILTVLLPVFMLVAAWIGYQMGSR